uniref:Uncharacterized protein n=1 Tax=Oryza glumipatula TaxID=40148 RepID=A0A0D9Y850_9ORYZ
MALAARRRGRRRIWRLCWWVEPDPAPASPPAVAAMLGRALGDARDAAMLGRPASPTAAALGVGSGRGRRIQRLCWWEEPDPAPTSPPAAAAMLGRALSDARDAAMLGKPASPLAAALGVGSGRGRRRGVGGGGSGGCVGGESRIRCLPPHQRRRWLSAFARWVGMDPTAFAFISRRWQRRSSRLRYVSSVTAGCPIEIFYHITCLCSMTGALPDRDEDCRLLQMTKPVLVTSPLS